MNDDDPLTLDEMFGAYPPGDDDQYVDSLDDLDRRRLDALGAEYPGVTNVLQQAAGECRSAHDWRAGAPEWCRTAAIQPMANALCGALDMPYAILGTFNEGSIPSVEDRPLGAEVAFEVLAATWDAMPPCHDCHGCRPWWFAMTRTHP